jgi:2-methylcitrate dehydratase PrpD
MLTRGSVGLRDYTDEGLNDPAVLRMADLISYRDDPSRPAGKGGSSAASIGKTTLEIRTCDGRVLTCRPTSVPGDPANPASQALLESKFRDCVAFSANKVGTENVDRAVKLIADLEHLPDISQVVSVLSAT